MPKPQPKLPRPKQHDLQLEPRLAVLLLLDGQSHREIVPCAQPIHDDKPAHTITHLAHPVHELSHLRLPLVRQPEQRKIPHSGHSLEIPIGGARWWEQTGGDDQHGPGVRGENPRVHLQILRDTGSERDLMRRKRGRQVQDVRRGIQDGLPRTKRSPLHANARVVGFRLEGLRAAGRSRGQGSPYVIVGRVVPGDLDNKPQRWVEL